MSGSRSLSTCLAATASTQPTPVLREACLEDYPGIASLQSLYGMNRWSREEWQHLWIANPAYLDEWPMGWVLEADSRIVGYLGNIPLQYELYGRSYIAGCGHSWVVAPRYRAYSLMLLERYLKQNHGADLCISNTVGLLSSSALAAFGVSPVPVGAWDHSAVWITQFKSFAALWLARNKYPSPNTFSYPMSLGLYLWSIGKMRALKKKNDRYVHIEFCDGFDERFDSFWHQLRTENPKTLLAVRSRSVLEWHFHYALREKRLWILAVIEGSQVTAYGLFLLDRDATGGLKQVTFLDFQFLGERERALYPMLLRALDRCHNEGVHMLLTVGLCSKGVVDIGAIAPFRVRQDTWTYWYKANNPSLDAALDDKQLWSPSLFDGDASL
jgi:hypothetical protein